MSTLADMAREAGRAGQSWSAWTGSDEVQAIVNSDSYAYELDSDKIESAYCEGRRDWRVASEGWRVAWTTAQADYDTGETEHVEDCGDYHGKKLRLVIIHPRNWVYQTSRYGSGLHPAWEKDPRAEDARVKAEQAERDARRAEYDAKRKAGLEWLATAPAPDVVDDDNFDLWESKGLTYQDIRAERTRRQENVAATARDAEWSRCAALVSEGATIVDDGSPGMRGKYGWIPGRPTHVWHKVYVVKGWQKDAGADQAEVRSEKLGDSPGSLLLVADYLTSGRLRIAGPEEKVPPSAVLERIGHEHLKAIRRVDVGGRVVWVGRRTFGETMVLDENGRIVRAKKIVEAALASA